MNNTISWAFKRNELVERYFRKINPGHVAQSSKSNRASGEKSLLHVMVQDKREFCSHSVFSLGE